MPRPSNTAERRAQIVAGLRRTMARRGYEGATVADVARAAGLAPGLVHYHFQDKREILLGLVAALAAEALARGDRAVAAAGPAPERRLTAWLEAFLSLDADPDPEAVACWVAVAAEAIRDEQVRGAFRRALSAQAAALRSLVGEALGARGRDRRAAPRIAAALLAQVQGAFLLSATAPGATPRGSAAALASRTALALVEGGT